VSQSAPLKLRTSIMLECSYNYFW